MTDIDNKIRSLDELANLCSRAKEKGLEVALCHGVFDLLHPGHIHHFEAVQKVADILVVTVESDKFANMGPGRPVFNQRLRAESVAALQSVDYVAINDSMSATETIQFLSPNIYAKGIAQAWDGGIQEFDNSEEQSAVQAIGGRMHVTSEINFSSTRLLNEYFTVFNPEVDEYIRNFRSRYTSEEVIEKLKQLQSLRVLVIGDIIIDEYHYCKAIGKSSKSATLTARFLSEERYAGGVLAVANHVAGFAKDVHLVTYLGDPKDEEAFIHENMKSNVNTHLIESPGRPIVVKRRYVDPFQISKMFEVMWLDGEQPPPDAEEELLKALTQLSYECDLIIIADFGHGNIGQRTIQWVTEQPTFLAVNTQTNSANTGYNLITGYSNADYICIDEEEIRLANQSRYGELSEIMERTVGNLGCQIASVTRGSKGSLTWDPEIGIVQTPIFSTEVIDSVGAGDAYLSITSLCAKAGYSPELIGFIGNCVGALAVRIIGNRESVEPQPLFQFISTLLK